MNCDSFCQVLSNTDDKNIKFCATFFLEWPLSVEVILSILVNKKNKLIKKKTYVQRFLENMYKGILTTGVCTWLTVPSWVKNPETMILYQTALIVTPRNS